MSFEPRVAATGKALQLAMQRLWLGGQVLPAGARLTVQHVFQSAEDAPIEVVYAFALPRDAAMRAFRIVGEGFEAHSELRSREEAVKAYEKGISQGSLSALARQYGDGVVNLTVGNIRPKETVTVYLDILAGVELRDDGFRFRFPFALAPTYHPQAKYGAGEIELPVESFGDVILPGFRKDASALHQIGFELTVPATVKLDSPSHVIGVQGAQVTLSPSTDVPNRDLVLDARFAAIEPRILAGKGRFAAVIPSTSFGANPETPRRVVILLDRSSSMRGPRLTQATRAIGACLGALSEKDQFGLVTFSSSLESFQDSLVPATRENRDKAHEFLRKVTAGGGTELSSGVQRAAEVLGQGGGDVIVFTDGEVGGTEAILAQARGAHIRLHCLGIGDASQDRFLAQLARETGGVSRYVTTNERVDLAAVDLFASVGRPVAAGLRTAANVQPAPPTAVFAGTPVLLFGESNDGLGLEWDGGSLHLPIGPGDEQVGETIRLLQGSRLIADWESRYASSEAFAPLEKRKQSRVAARLEELSREYGLASREMSLVAVVKRAGDRPDELPETRVVPVGTPPDVRFDAYFGAAGGGSAMPNAMANIDSLRDQVLFSIAPAQSTPGRLFRSLFSTRRKAAAEALSASEDPLFDLAAQLDGDGGMPGRDMDERAGNTVAALCAFLAAGHSPTSGAFRSHADRMVKFLASYAGKYRQLVTAILEMASRGEAPPGDWLKLAGKSGGHWKEIERAVAQAAKAVKK